MDLSKFAPKWMLEEEAPTSVTKPIIENSRPVGNPVNVVPVTTGYIQPASTTYYQPTVGTNDVSQNDAYITLCQTVNFDTTEVGTALHKYLDPLANLANINESTKFMMAWAQVQSIDHVTKERFLATFDGLIQALGQQSTSFNDFIQNQTETMIVPKNQKMTDLTAKLSELQKQMQDTAAELNQTANEKADAEGKIAKAVSQFNSALSLRTNEINADKAKYQNLLG